MPPPVELELELELELLLPPPLELLEEDELLLEEDELLLEEDELLLEDELLEPPPPQAASASDKAQALDSLNKFNWFLVILIPHRLVKNIMFFILARRFAAICIESVA